MHSCSQTLGRPSLSRVFRVLGTSLSFSLLGPAINLSLLQTPMFRFAHELVFSKVCPQGEPQLHHHHPASPGDPPRPAAPLAFKAKYSRGSSSWCRTPRLDSLMWGSELSLHSTSFCSAVLAAFRQSELLTEPPLCQALSLMPRQKDALLEPIS
ncbi:hypothetical protein Cadr_000009328 [Camelus dromedarius]|uniref:Uncharacterized protein n=1 Tax=Camelus dromedarius TaxID=9838 RepID=A0A5N4DKE8_CAMDR|nr:hypothetical protein Cadr_000009328 [Camelus dromedarius]